MLSIEYSAVNMNGDIDKPVVQNAYVRIGESIPWGIAVEDIISVFADEDELMEIQTNFQSIPFKLGAKNNTWRGLHAAFIVENWGW